MFAGIDAHSNLGFHMFGDDAGGRVLNLKFDRYATIFRLFRIHVLLEKSKPLTRESLVAAMKDGRYYTGFDSLGESERVYVRGRKRPLKCDHGRRDSLGRYG